MSLAIRFTISPSTDDARTVSARRLAGLVFLGNSFLSLREDQAIRSRYAELRLQSDVASSYSDFSEVKGRSDGVDQSPIGPICSCRSRDTIPSRQQLESTLAVSDEVIGPQATFPPPNVANWVVLTLTILPFCRDFVLAARRLWNGGSLLIDIWNSLINKSVKCYLLSAGFSILS